MTDYTLKKSSHKTREDGMCAMEWVAYIAGERHSDAPLCVCPVLRKFTITLNDVLDNETRQRLRPYLTRTIGTADDGQWERRKELLRREAVVANPSSSPQRLVISNPKKAFDLLEQMLPTEHIDLPDPARQELDRLLSA